MEMQLERRSVAACLDAVTSLRLVNPHGTVRVTGLFDHPAARACTATTYEPASTKPDPSCRWAFAVTSLTAVKP
jgi:hypothetical protein